MNRAPHLALSVCTLCLSGVPGVGFFCLLCLSCHGGPLCHSWRSNCEKREAPSMALMMMIAASAAFYGHRKSATHLTPFPRRGFAANGTPRGPAFARPPRPKTTDSAALFWQRYGTKCKKGIAMRSALILRDFGQISAGKRACPCHQGLTVIRETQTGYSLSCLRVPDLGPPYRSSPGRERFPCIARA